MHEPSESRVRIGRGIAIIRGSTRILLDERNGELADRLWRATENAEDVADIVLEELSATGLRSLGDFAIAEHEDGGVRFVVRGTGVAQLLGDDVTVNFDAGDSRTWAEQVVSDAAGYVLSLGPVAERPPLPFRLGQGLVPADLVAWGVGGDDTAEGVDLEWVESFEPVVPVVDEQGSTPASASDEVVGVEVDTAEVDNASPAGQDSDAASSNPDATIEAEPVSTSSPEEGAGTEDTADDAAENDQLDGEQRFDTLVHLEDQHEVEVPVVTDDGHDDEGYEYDEMFGRTQLKPVDRAGVVIDDDGRPQQASPDPIEAPDPVPLVPDSGASRPASVEPTPESGGLIDGIPGTSSPAPAAGVPQQGDHDGHTMSLAQLQALRAGQQGASLPIEQPALGGDSVRALMCASGHPSPPTAVVCRSCGAPVSGDPVTIARPRLGRLRLSNGQVVELERPVILGRAPKVEGQARGVLPNTLALPEFDGLSRTHVMVHLEQWQVLIEDLGSQNGTILQLRGREPQRLHARVQTPLENGAVVDLAGEVTFTVELG